MLLVISLLLVYALALVGFALRFRKSDASRKEPNDTGVSRPPESGDLYRVKAGEYGLTEREEEVLLLMLKGRNLPFISEKLVISKNTVRSHFKSIYRKCGVHSKQKLLDLFEAKLLTKPADLERQGLGNHFLAAVPNDSRLPNAPFSVEFGKIWALFTARSISSWREWIPIFA